MPEIKKGNNSANNVSGIVCVGHGGSVYHAPPIFQ